MKEKIIVGLIFFLSCSSEKTKIIFYDFYHFEESKNADFPTLCVSAHTDIFSDYQKELDVIYDLGFKIVRRDFLWREIEPNEGKYDENVVEKYDRFVFELRKRDIEPLYLLVFGNYWASEESKKCFQECKNQNCSYCDKFSPDPSKFANFAKFVVQRFSARYIEVWNEPNWIFFMNPVSPEKYAMILSETYKTVKSSDLKVIFGGLLSADVQLPKVYFIKPDEFLSSYNFEEFFDAVAIHPYIGKRLVSYPPTLPPEDSNNSYAPLPAIISSIRGITKKDIWITEMGWPTYSDGISQFSHAIYIVRAIFLSAIMGIKTFCVYELVDSFWNLIHPAESHFGIVNSDYSPKIAYYSLKNLSKFRNRKYIGSVKVESEIQDIIVFSPLFQGDQGSSIVLWAVSSQGNDLDKKIKAKLFIPSELVILISDVFGNFLPHIGAKDHVTIDVDSVPIIIDVKF